MGNLVKYTMTNVPAGLSQMYTRVTDTANNELFSGVKPVSGNAVELDIGTAGNIGDGAIIFADNFEGNIPSFKASVGYSLIEAGDVPVPSNYSNVVIIGSSTIQASFGRDLVTPNEEATSLLASKGSTDVSVYGYGFSGFTMSGLVPKIQEAFDAFPNNDTLFIFECGANDVSANRPRSSMSPQDVLDFQSDIDSMFALIDTRKEDCIPLLLGYRNYSDPQVNDDVFFDSSLGIKPFNDEFFLPKIQADYLSTLNSDGNSLIDVYNFIRNNYAEQLGPDGLHHTAEGYVEYREFLIDRLNSILKSEPINVIVPAPTVDSGNKVYVSLGSTATNSDGLNAFDMEYIGGSSSIKASLSDLNGDTAKPRLKPVTGWFTNMQGSGILTGATDFDGTTLFCTQALQDGAFDGSTKTLSYTVDRLDPNTNYDLEFISSRSSATYRETLVSSGPESVVIVNNSDPAEQPKGFTVQSDANGELTFTQATNNAQNHYLNGFSLQKSL